MILKPRTKNKQLAYLEALVGRTPFDEEQIQLLKQLQTTEQLEIEFEHYLKHINQDAFDIIWQFNYSDYHVDALINVILVSETAIYLFKLNHYEGLHYVNNEGILSHYITEKPMLDLLQLNCVKYSIYSILDAKYKHLPIYIKCVCMAESFELDPYTDQYPFLFKKDIMPYINKINQLNKKKVLNSVST
ncbi:hypothetical protein [Macrococcoides caseolyticum]|uniref:hypothetical protein n=1 Tax=Macrococcoides caseolyticum TaxID=69966 RepID=UPI001F18A6DD|nr:hypothetical protein [Macrococcus caseolyticus]MCE4956906.1 hypothetical protein [Macrococcus caseolyticus]